MPENVSNLETRLSALEARLAQHETEIGRLRKLLRQSRRRGWLLALAGVAGLLIASASWLLPAAAQGGKEGGGGAGIASTGTGNPVSLGVTNAPTSSNDATSIYDPSFTTLMTRTLRIANYTVLTADIGTTYDNFRTAIVGFTSGPETPPGSQTRVGVMGLVDQNGYGVYGASPSGIGGAFAGGAAQLRLVPGATAGPPSGASHLMGELYLDSLGDLYLCTQGGPTPRWVRLGVSAAYLPMVKSP